MVRDLLMSHPTPENLHIVPTARDPTTGLALSSRNLYLSPSGLSVAPTLRQALVAAQDAWNAGKSKAECIEAAKGTVEAGKKKAEELGVEMKLDYVEMNDANSFDILEGEARKEGDKTVILSGALYVDKTRLIDNILLGETGWILG